MPHRHGKHYLRNLDKRNAAKRRMLMNALDAREYGEFDGLVVNDSSELPEGYSGMALVVNDHGNVSLVRVFKNGNTHYVYGIV